MFRSSRVSYKCIPFYNIYSHNRKTVIFLNRVRILGLMECKKTGNDCFRDTAFKNNVKLKKYYAENPVKQPV